MRLSKTEPSQPIASKRLIVRLGISVWVVTLNGAEHCFWSEAGANSFLAKNMFKQVSKETTPKQAKK